MFKKLGLVLLPIAIVIAPGSFANINRAPCDREYDKCKEKVENLFDKKPCRKAREHCVATLTQKQKGNTKRKMLMGADPQAEPKSAAAAKERLKARAQAKSMRDSIKSN